METVPSCQQLRLELHPRRSKIAQLVLLFSLIHNYLFNEDSLKMLITSIVQAYLCFEMVRHRFWKQIILIVVETRNK